MDALGIGAAVVCAIVAATAWGHHKGWAFIAILAAVAALVFA
ncbi:MAG: hypothetical protein ABSG05_02870 [Candidatus Pacearchaeota archaeon]|jgi:hypothetical protein